MSRLMFVEEALHASEDSAYWDECNPVRRDRTVDPLWRRYCDALHTQLLQKWCDFGPQDRVLKTDLFEEAVGEGVVPFLSARAGNVTGIDVARTTVEAARRRHPRMQGAVTDVRALPFRDGSFDGVVSISTLDHFRSRREIAISLGEIGRVLRPGGTLVLTMDNPRNPAVAVRNALPFPMLHRMGIVPYRVGAACGPGSLRRMAEAAGFEVLACEAIMHVPRVAAVAASRFLRHGRQRSKERFLRLLGGAEKRRDWPTRFLTGNFIAIRAKRR